MTPSAQTSHAAVADLCKLFGSPKVKTVGDVKVFTWRGSTTNDPDSILSLDGDGIMICRCPRIDHSSPERVWNELRELLAMIQWQGLRPSTLLVTFGGSGNRSYAERRQADVGEIEAGAVDGRYRWAAYSDFERISRSTEAFEQILSSLRNLRIDLYLGRQRHKIDWTRDAMLLQACGVVVGAEDRR